MSSNSSQETDIDILFEAEEAQSSGEEAPMSEWSSLEVAAEVINRKKLLYSQCLYTPGSGEVCAKYIPQSDSDVLRHVYFNYPPNTDPGIVAALRSPEIPTIYGDDGLDTYMALCKEMNVCPVSPFYTKLLTSTINLSYYGVSPSGVRPMAIALQYNKSVKTLDFTDNFLSDDACYHLGQMLNVNNTIEVLNLTGCRIGVSGLRCLGVTLHNNKTLNTLNLARNAIGEDGGVYFANMIANGFAPKRVGLSKNGLAREAVKALAEILFIKDKIITHFDLSMNELHHSPSTVKLFQSLADSKILQEINLSWTSLEGEKVAEALKNLLLIPTLNHLDLSHNRLNSEPLEIFLSLLPKAKKLVTLDLSSNPLSPEDALITLKMMLQRRVKLQNLLLGNVWVNKKFLLVLADVKKMKSRKNFTVEYAGVLKNWAVTGPDARELILKRADYLCKLNKRRKLDVGLFFLALYKESPKPIFVSELVDRLKADAVPLDERLVVELANLFPGPKSSKGKLISVAGLCDFVQRLWPERRLPPTPPPEPEPEPEPEPVPEIKPEPSKPGKKGKK